MSWAYVAVAGAGVAGSLIGANASRGAADTQANAANQASQTQLGMFNQTQQNLQPWMQAGQTSLGQLMQQMGLGGDPNAPGYGQLTHQFGLGDFQASPAYQFNLEQGKMALDKASRARGKFYAPSTLQDIAKFSQGMASNEFQNAYGNYQNNMGNIYNRLQGISNSGQNAAANLGTAATATGQQIGGNLIGAGNAQAAGQIGSANALGGGLNNLTNQYYMNQLLSNNQQSSVPTNYIEQNQ